MAIKEESFRIGCGRYIQGAGYIERAGEEICRVGTAPLVIGDDTALSLTRVKLEESIGKTCKAYEILTHNGTCNDERAKELAAYAKENGFDVFVGTGGGVIMDFAKLCGHFAGLPVINIPTSSATCAAYTPLSIRYTPEGQTVGSLHFEEEVNGVICDTQIISAQPARLLLAGVFDALAKFVEIKHLFREDAQEYPMGLDYAYFLAKYSYKFLTEKTQQCIDDAPKGCITPTVENMIFTCIAATGVISGIARGSNQSALAHKFYETAKFLFPKDIKSFLHGEIVGIGLLIQNHYNGEEENNEAIMQFMKTYDMPHCLTDIGIAASKETFDDFYEKLSSSGHIDPNNEDECRRLKESMEYLWQMQ